jgi:uncharacterized membrane protein
VRGHRDLELASVAAAVCALVALLSPLPAIALIAAIPLTLVLPGYVVTAAIFGRNGPDAPRMALLTLALSLAVLVLGSLLLNYMPGGIRSLSWGILLVLVVLASARLAAIRRRPPRKSSRSRRRPGRRLSPAPLDAVLFAVGGLAAVGAIVLAQIPVTASNADGFTALWMLPSQDGGRARVGISSNEQAPTSYRLYVRTERDSGITKRFTLDPGEERRFSVELTPDLAGRRVTASLYRDQKPQRVYRRVTSWLPDEAR